MNKNNEKAVDASFTNPVKLRKTVVIGGLSSSQRLAAMAAMQGMVIAAGNMQPVMSSNGQRFNGTLRLDEVVDFRRPDIVAWNKAVDRKKAEKKALKRSRK